MMLVKNKLVLSFLPSIIYFVFYDFPTGFGLIEITDGRYGGSVFLKLGGELKILLSLLCIPLLVTLLDSPNLKERIKRLWHGQSYQSKKDD